MRKNITMNNNVLVLPTKTYLLNTLLFLSVLLLATSCQKDGTNKNDIDGMLEESLISASNGQGLEYFRLPNANDLSKIPQDPNNPLTKEKINLGKLLFHETALATNPIHTVGKGTYSCATCHHVQGGFQANRKQSVGDGGQGFGMDGSVRSPFSEYTIEECDFQPLRTPSALNVAYQKNMLWNGQFGATGLNEGTEDRWNRDFTMPTRDNFWGFEGVETQAIAGLKVHRMDVTQDLLEEHPAYKPLFDAAFPDYAEENRYSRITAGLAIGAYERALLSNEAPFQKWLQGDFSAMNEEEKQGALLFFGKAQCATCHTGPALNKMDFYALGMDDLQGETVLGAYDADDSANKGRGGFTGNDEDMYKYKVPQLYNLKDSPFYGHGGNFNSIEDVVAYKNNAVPQNYNVPNEQLADSFQPLNLTDAEIQQISTFIENALADPNLERYVPDVVLSGNCFPNNDIQSKEDLGCE